MYQPINVDKAAEHVKNIVDSNRCAICDKATGKRLRYPCGHSGCVDCVPDIGSCPLCLTPQDSSTIDEPQTLRSLNAQKLLNTFETFFSVDVNNRKRVSEKLKVEKELFPQCIQAPVKYYNKRKSAKLSTGNKENITVFPGEELPFRKMDNSNANVRDWLSKCVKRKPFADLNHTITNNKQLLKASNTQNILCNRSLNKRNYGEIWPDENETCIENFHETPIKKQKFKTNKKKVSHPKLVHKNKKDDSGIAVDEDEGIIVLQDSQSIRVDKDEHALLAILEVEKNAKWDSAIQNSMLSRISDKLPQHNLKVPFYKKSPLAENCDYCKEYHKAVNKNNSEREQNVSITVESKSFTAIINISIAENTNTIKTKQSVEVQTDLKNLADANQQIHDKKDDEANDNHSSKSDDIFLGEAINFSPVASVNKYSNIIIAESDSDDDLEHSRSLEVTADVHRSYDEMVLGDVENLEEHGKRPRRIARGHTPASTDSSEKENYNPNRTKRSTISKKKPMKK